MQGRLIQLGVPSLEKDISRHEGFIASLEMRLSDGQNIMVTGQCRNDTTGIAIEVLRRLKLKGHYVAYIDLLGNNTKKELSLSIINACLENSNSISGLETERASDHDLFVFSLQFPEMLARRDKKHIVIVFDEFQEILRITGENILKVMRSYLQMQECVSYLFLGSKEGMMNSIFGETKQAFYRFATIL